MLKEIAETTIIDDLRHTAYAYHEAAKGEKENGNVSDAAINALFNEMDTNRDELISFDEFKKYMKTAECERFSNKDFFDKLKSNKKGNYLKYCDVVTLIYVIQSGRPFCEKCKVFVEGLFFTCVHCFEKEKDYYYNFCSSCYYAGKNHTHCHREFMDPVSLLRLKAKRELVKPMAAVLHDKTTPSDSKTSLTSSSSTSSGKKDESRPTAASDQTIQIIVQNPQPCGPIIKKPTPAMKLMQFAVSATTIAAAVSQFCTIM